MMGTSVGLSGGDAGVNFLFIFLVFWALVIVAGVVLQLYEMGFHRGHWIERTKEIYRKWIGHLENRNQ